MKNLAKDSFLDLLIAVPTPPEQRAITAALSDVDALLGGLTALIAKKRDLKQAAIVFATFAYNAANLDRKLPR